MRVSIVIPNYNGINYIEECIDSILTQDFKDFEIIIIDNCSSDGSCELIKSKYPYIKLICNPENYGFSKAVNEGILASKGEYVILLNNDTKVESDWVSKLVHCMDQKIDVFSCCSKMISYNERDKIDDAGDFYTLLGWTIKRGMGKNVRKYCRDSKIFSSCAGAAIYNKRILNKIGYFDENFYAYMEDVDIGYRAKIFGYNNFFCSNAIVYHIGSATSGSKYNSFKVRLAARNNIYVIFKNMPAIQLIINLPFILLGFFIKWIFFYIKGFGSEYIIGIKEGIKNLNKIEKIVVKRKNIKNYVKIELDIILNTFKYIFS